MHFKTLIQYDIDIGGNIDNGPTFIRPQQCPFVCAGEWSHWDTKVKEYHYPKETTPDYGTILVPNVDNIRTDFLIHTIAKQGKQSVAMEAASLQF